MFCRDFSCSSVFRTIILKVILALLKFYHRLFFRRGTLGNSNYCGGGGENRRKTVMGTQHFTKKEEHKWFQTLFLDKNKWYLLHVAKKDYWPVVTSYVNITLNNSLPIFLRLRHASETRRDLTCRTCVYLFIRVNSKQNVRLDRSHHVM